MRLAYATTDEVNQGLAIRVSAACGAVVCRLRPGNALPEGLVDAVLYDLDDVPTEQRAAFVHGLCLDPPLAPRRFTAMASRMSRPRTSAGTASPFAQLLHSGLLAACAKRRSQNSRPSRA